MLQVSRAQKKMWKFTKIMNSTQTCAVYQIYAYAPPGETSICASKGYRLDYIDLTHFDWVGVKRNGPANFNEFRLIGEASEPNPFLTGSQFWCSLPIATPAWP